MTERRRWSKRWSWREQPRGRASTPWWPRRADAGKSFEEVGSIGGAPSAFVSSGKNLYAALGDGNVLRSTDGGANWGDTVIPAVGERPPAVETDTLLVFLPARSLDRAKVWARLDAPSPALKWTSFQPAQVAQYADVAYKRRIIAPTRRTIAPSGATWRWSRAGVPGT